MDPSAARIAALAASAAVRVGAVVNGLNNNVGNNPHHEGRAGV